MLRLVVGILSLASGSWCESTDFHESSVSGATPREDAFPSRLFIPQPLTFTLSGVVNELKKAAEAIRKGNEDQGNEFILATLRLMGIDSGKIKDLAFDGIISLVQLLGQTLLNNGRSARMERTESRGSLFHFVLRQPQVANLLKQMRDPVLVDVLLEESADDLQDSEGDIDCIRLLLCKTGPFVRGMQRSLEFFMKREGIQSSGDEEACTGTRREEFCRGGSEEASWEKASLEDRMYFFLPDLGEVTAHGDNCDLLFPNCEY